MSDSLAVIIWWTTIFLIGTICLPITNRIFKNFADRGYIFSKVIGILIASYIMWLFASLHVVPFARISLIVILLGLAIVNLWISMIRNVKNDNKSIPWRLIIFEEAVFLACLSFWSFVRATEPSIRGLEKFMDFGFVNSILRSSFFPPLDMWLTQSPDYSGGYFINYYYFGHYLTAFLTKLSGLDSAVSYNLMLATLFAFTFTLPFSIGLNLSQYLIDLIHQKEGKSYKPYHFQAIIIGLLTAFLVSLGGNLHTIYSFTSGYPNDNPQPPWNLSWGFYPNRYWYPNATRFIPFTIHEFPIYSYVVADLHGHVSDIPFVLLTLAILLTLVINKKREVENLHRQSFLSDFEQHTSIPFFYVALLGILLAVMYMTNAWDGMIYMVLSGLVFLYMNMAQGKIQSLWNSLYKTFSASLFLLFFFLIASLPFSLNFRPFVSGIGVLCSPTAFLGKNFGPFLFETGKCQKSEWWMLLFLWGFFYYNVIGYFVFVILRTLKNKFQIPSTKSQTNSKFQAPNPKQFENLYPTDIFILLLILISTLLLIFPEFFYIKDIYPAHYRANTMFKLGYQSFMMLGIVSAYAIFRIKLQYLQSRKSLSLITYNTIFIALFTLVAIYPYFAINSYYGGLKTYHGLFGLNWMQTQYPNDYQAVLWLRNNIVNQPVIVEANGDSYTDYARVSANTGLPTIVGWPVHEWLWRGSYDEAGKRIPEVVAIYESKDLEQTKSILKKYNAEYIFVGNLEREKYKNLDEKKFEKFGRVVFESGDTKIYKINTVL